MGKVGAVIVTYDPKLELKKHIYAALSQVDIVVLVDNSENQDSLNDYGEFLSNSNSYFVIKNNENMGMAKALNQGCSYLKDKGCSHALMLDQDSDITESMVKTLYGYSSSMQKCGIVGPLIIPSNIDYDLIKSKLRFVKRVTPFTFARVHPPTNPFEVAFNITSGSLCNLKIWEELGGFLEELFIDGVDNEYGLRLLNSGYTTVIHPEAVLYQEYGAQKTVRFFGRNYFPTFHGYLRRYYSSRNRLLIWKRYFFTQPFYLFWDFMSFANTIKMILLFEDQKLKKILYIYMGIRDGLFNKTGKFHSGSKC